MTSALCNKHNLGSHNAVSRWPPPIEIVSRLFNYTNVQYSRKTSKDRFFLCFFVVVCFFFPLFFYLTFSFLFFFYLSLSFFLSFFLFPTFFLFHSFLLALFFFLFFFFCLFLFFSHLLFLFHYFSFLIFPVGWWGAVKYTDCFSAEGWDSSRTMSILDMTLNNLMVKFQ